MILIGIGSNLESDLYGSPIQNCIQAIKFLEKKVKILKISQYYKTEPIPKSEQPWYINVVISVKTSYPPNKLLRLLNLIERNFKRVRRVRNEARVIDLDILAYEKKIFSSEKLTIPHPRMHLRKFVIKPLCDLNEEWIHPVLRISAKKILKTLAKQNIYNINSE